MVRVEQELGVEAGVADETSRAFLGQWQVLVSSTNWEKGRIIRQWREALISSGASIQQYSDEAWSRRVNGVTAQHVGRLRRVYERFEETRADYPKLYWSHFQAALDWNDAEMWLEGAVQNEWSIAEMRQQRWEAFGGNAEDQLVGDDDASAELDEDYSAGDEGVSEVHAPANRAGSDFDVADDATVDEQSHGNSDAGEPFDPEGSFAAEPAEVPSRPFEHLAELPPDLSEAFEAFKLAILRHKLAGWAEISSRDVLASLDALRQLALAPADA
jgi:hypothetical protein